VTPVVMKSSILWDIMTCNPLYFAVRDTVLKGVECRTFGGGGEGVEFIN
jgi:hypothetical protein